MTIAKIQWPGPRPFRFAANDDQTQALQPHELPGRRRELGELRTAVQSAAVVEITAPSGVGKTSFVNASAPFLIRAGGRVRRARPWSEVLKELTPQDGPAALYARALGERPVPEDELAALVRRIAGDRFFIPVFDQIEELLRYSRRDGRGLLELIGRLAPRTGTPHVVIARSEFRDELRPVEVAGTPMWHIYLEEITAADVIRQIIAEPAENAGVTFQDAAVDQILEWWNAARSERGVPERDASVHIGEPEFGLLHLQALLWTFKEWAVAGNVAPNRITHDDVLGYIASRGLTTPARGTSVLEDAMFAYVHWTVGGCEAPGWPNGPRLMIARIARHLSSAGYKVPQAGSSLVPLALHEELPASTDGRALARRLRDATTTRDAARALKNLGFEGAGLAADWPDDKVAVEMVASLNIGLDHLADEKTNVLRKFARGHDTIYELVHDGVGHALNRWAESLLDDPVAVIGVIAARTGQPMRHDLTAATFDDERQPSEMWGSVIREGDRAALRDLKWIGNSVGRLGHEASRPRSSSTLEKRGGLLLENLVFERCSFRGTVFLGVEMRNVTFRNCVFWGVAMINCSFENVCFDDAGGQSALDTLVIRDCWPNADVTFANVDGVEGLFVTNVRGGTWNFDNVNVDHFVIRSIGNAPFALGIDGKSRFVHATIKARSTARVTLGDDVVVHPRSDPKGLLGGRALPPTE